MRANISDELLNKINDRIYIDLEIHVLTKKMNESDNEGFTKYLDHLIDNLIKERKEVNTFLIKNGVKIYDVREIDDMFIEYPYSQKIDGGYKEGTQRFWKSAVKYHLKQRMSKYFGGD
jgi:hypothetical protein